MRVADSLNNALVVRDSGLEVFQDSVIHTKKDIYFGEGDSNRYYIIVGSFTEPENAMEVAVQFQNQGYQTSIIKRRNSQGTTLFSVSVKSFNDLEEAEKFKREVQSTVLPSAWMYHPE